MAILWEGFTYCITDEFADQDLLTYLDELISLATVIWNQTSGMTMGACTYSMDSLTGTLF